MTSSFVAALRCRRLLSHSIHSGREGTAPRGEVALYYDHRHDDFAAGLKMPGLGSGVPGHIGARGHAFLTRAFGMKAELEAGSAILGGASLLFRTNP